MVSAGSSQHSGYIIVSPQNYTPGGACRDDIQGEPVLQCRYKKQTASQISGVLEISSAGDKGIIG